MTTSERLDPPTISATSAYDRESLRLHLERYEFAAQFVSDRAVVDCACGTGYGSEMLALAGARLVLGVDISSDAVEYGRRHHARPNIKYYCCDALKFEPALRPDVWVTLETVEHLESPAAYLRAVHFHLVPEGMLIASVPTTVSTDGNPYHRHDFSRESWKKLLAECGFEVVVQWYQVHRFTLRQLLERNRPECPRIGRRVIGFYLAHPRVACRRLALTVTRGLIHEYSVTAARRGRL